MVEEREDKRYEGIVCDINVEKRRWKNNRVNGPSRTAPVSRLATPTDSNAPMFVRINIIGQTTLKVFWPKRNELQLLAAFIFTWTQHPLCLALNSLPFFGRHRTTSWHLPEREQSEVSARFTLWSYVESYRKRITNQSLWDSVPW